MAAQLQLGQVQYVCAVPPTHPKLRHKVKVKVTVKLKLKRGFDAVLETS